MKKVGSWVLTILAFIFLGVLIYYGYKLIVKVINMLFSLPPEVSTTIIAGVFTVLVSVLSLTIGKYLERKRVIENEIRQQKIPIYEDFIKFSFDIFMSQKKDQPKKTEKEMTKYFNDFTYQLIIWGSDDVITTWSDFKQDSIKDAKLKKEDRNSIKTMYGFEKVLLAIRKDTGHNNKGFTQGSLLRLFINDLDENKKD